MDDQLIGLRGVVGWAWFSGMGGRKRSYSIPADWSATWRAHRGSTMGWRGDGSSAGYFHDGRSQWGGKQRVR